MTNVDEPVDERELLRAVSWNKNWCSHYGKQNAGSSEKLKMKLPCYTLTLLKGIYLKK